MHYLEYIRIMLAAVRLVRARLGNENSFQSPGMHQWLPSFQRQNVYVVQVFVLRVIVQHFQALAIDA